MLRKGDLAAYLEKGCRPKERFRIGTEHEKFGFSLKNRAPLAYGGKTGMRALLQKWARRGEAEPVMEDGHILGLRFSEKEGGAVSLEPGGQLELSGAPRENIHQTKDELDDHLAQLRALSDSFQIGFLALAFPPHWKRTDMSPVPKKRYAIMAAHMLKRGRLGLDMMYRTATTQVNLDFSSEEDMRRKMRVAVALSPLATALFANSPLCDGKDSGVLSRRALSWRDTDPDRAGMIPFVFDEGFGFERYADYALDVPLYCVHRGGRTISLAGESFRRFMEGKLEPLPRQRPTVADWEEHLTTLFPEARLKRFMEMRGADVGTPEMICALAAFWTGLLYDSSALHEVSDLVEDWTAEERERLYQGVCRDGLALPFRGATLKEIALQLLEIAERGLRQRRRLNEKGHDESVYLKPLHEIAQTGQASAARLLEKYRNLWKGDAMRLFDDPEHRFF